MQHTASVGPTLSASSKSTSQPSASTSARAGSTTVASGVEPDLPLVAEAFDLVGILSAVEETAYSWDLVSDRIEWEQNAGKVLGLADVSKIASGADFQFMVAPEHLAQRHEAVSGFDDAGDKRGRPFRLQYRFLPEGRRSDRSIWLEEHGRCWFDKSGKPSRVRGVIRLVNDGYWEEQRLLHRADNDDLTGQLTRQRLNDAMVTMIGRAQRTDQQCAILMASVNNLAVINETFGFDVGDEVIAGTARIIKSKLRGGDVLGRYTSNKFGIILADCGPGAMEIAAQRFINAVRSVTIETSVCQVSAAISIGGVVAPEQVETASDAVSSALQALEEAKHKRFECFVPFKPSAVRESTRQHKISIADEIVSALEDHRMHLVLQPMVSAKTGNADIYECLMRMEKPDGEIVAAGQFIEVAEQLGLSRLIDRRSLELATDLLKQHPKLNLALNVSALTTTDHDWLEELRKLTGGRRNLTERLTIEITETVAIHDLDQTVAFVDTLRELGCQVAIDDFGAGYTSFKNLKILDVDMVKIDGAFVKNIIEETSDQVFIRTMVELANEFNMVTVAEWVGDQETVDFLTRSGITYLQGFFYGKPFPASEYAEGMELPPPA
jgi:diguanylate cyclase (GGDEF)-like protein